MAELHKNLINGEWVGTEGKENINPSNTNDVVGVYAPSQVTALAELLAARGLALDLLAAARVVAIGETTAAALRVRGVRVDAIAPPPHPDAMAQALAAVYPGRT